MGRLIDADALLNEFNPDSDALIDNILARTRIAKQPTAYSVGKVVAELEELRDRYDDGIKNFAIRGIIEKAIEIVKQGGASDDVCEWHCDEYGRWHTECHILADNDPLEYTYCPYCGKKIKVVE